ncbi:BatD [hydrothermal vent metagenome]|uniref:BatD n=1 Tax=hydrothermal vent metagenome TaxID=652676 RepID=A0A1W1BUM0_9ZZZZ
MKKSLGKIFLILFLLYSVLEANDLASYKLSANKSNPFVKEAVVVTFEALQKDYTDNMMFSLQPKKSSDYRIVLLSKQNDAKQKHHAHTIFTYLLFPLSAGEITVAFDLTIRTASDSAIAQSVVDDHDDSIGVNTHDTKIAIEPLILQVQKLSKDTALVGDFSLKEKIKQTTINQYQSINIIYTLEGVGYENKSFRPIHKIDGVTMFFETNTIYAKATKNGYKIKREYIYALSAKKSFTIPAVEIKAFSPKKREYYTLHTAKHDIHVTKIDTSKLLDNEESPQTKNILSSEKIKEFFIYIFLFVLGYISAKLQSFTINKRKTDSKELAAVKKAQTAKELLFVIINNHLENNFADEVALLEDMVYNNTNHTYNTIKNKIIKRLK